jgi:hypothetical protein
MTFASYETLDFESSLQDLPIYILWQNSGLST